MATVALCSCCGIDAEANVGTAVPWPPEHPPVTEESNGITLIGGYLKRLNNYKPGDENSEARWVVRWIELEYQTWQDRTDDPEILLSVYKSDAKAKRLNAVIFKRIKVRAREEFVICSCPHHHMMINRSVVCVSRSRRGVCNSPWISTRMTRTL